MPSEATPTTHILRPSNTGSSPNDQTPVAGSSNTEADPTLQAQQYTKGSLSASQLHPKDPLSQFRTWFASAQDESVHQPETTTLSTSELPSGRISSRMVYLKELDETGFVVYSNWATSRKARDVSSNPRASLCFWWREIERQVRVEGRVERLSAGQSQVYYDTRIRGSRVGAWASRQSAVLRDRDELNAQVEEVEKRFESVDRIPVPEFWGGLRVVPDYVEFWQGRESRLHDRFRYTLQGDGSWVLDRLSP